MRRVILRTAVFRLRPDEVYQRISDFRRYPELTSTVRKVVVHPTEPDGSVVSDWTVTFRNGLLCWTERDEFDPQALSIRFTQLSGDFERFEGRWVVTDGEAEESGATTVTFDAVFDLGMPSLKDILDPVAEATLRDNILIILRGLLGEVALVDGPVPPAEPVVAGHGAGGGHA